MNTGRKNGRYQRIYEQLQGLFAKPGNRLSRMATLTAVLSHKLDHFFWTGFYLLDGDELIVGPYQGPVACQLLARDTGVCWAGINQRKSIIVPDVHQFPGHIACDSRSNSEIVIPVYDPDGRIEGVLDVDSRDFDAFDETDRIWLEKMVSLL